MGDRKNHTPKLDEINELKRFFREQNATLFSELDWALSDKHGNELNDKGYSTGVKNDGQYEYSWELEISIHPEKAERIEFHSFAFTRSRVVYEDGYEGATGGTQV